MKKKYLALLLSIAVTFSGIPTVASAAPDTMEQIVETTASTETVGEETDETTESTEIISENTGEATEPTETTSEDSGEVTASEETTSEETAKNTEAVETTSEEADKTIESAEATESIDAATEDSDPVFSEETTESALSIEESCEESSVEDAVVILEDTFTINPSYNDTMSYAAYNAENSSLSESDLFAEEDVSGVPYVEVKTLLQNEDAIRSQLSTDFELQLYDAGKKSIVEKGYNYIKLSGISEYYDTWDEICNAFSALAAAYPNKFNWMNWTNATFGRQVYYYKDSKTYSYKYTLKKSAHYTSGLETKAAAKVKTLVAEATEVAKKEYPECPAYGMIAYFNNWLCENSYFEREHGTSDEASIQKGKIYYYSHSCYGPLLYGYGTSEGYALAMSRLLDAAGIRNLYVTGSYNGENPYSEYAWNYIEMPDGYWYLTDTIRNDIECDNIEDDSDYDYLLISPEAIYEADSRKWKVIADSEIGMKLDYEALINAASGDYVSDTSENEQLETLTLNKETVVLKPGQKFQLSLIDSNKGSTDYYEKFVKTWTSDNKKIAKISKTGLITAGTVLGKTVITVESANRIFTCDVYVYQFTNIKFDANNKTKYTASYANEDTIFDEEDLQTITLTVNQKNPQISAQEVVSGNNLNEAIAKSNKPKIATVKNVTLEDDTIILDVLPKAAGTAQITVTLAGKKAYYTIKITQDLQEEWFDYSNIKDTVYSGKAIKPSIPLTEAGRDCSPKATYKITYSNNKNAGEAIIAIKGTGKYSDTLTQTFTIFPKDMSSAVFRSCTSSKTYNTKALAPATTVKLGKTTLKAGRDYSVLYKRTDTVSGNAAPSDIIPTEAGTYEVSIIGKGNYEGELPESQVKTYTIKPNPIKNMTVSYRSTIKYTGEPVNALKSVKISKRTLPPENYKVTYLDHTGTEIPEAIEKGKYTLVVTPVGDNIKPSLTKTCIKKKFTIK